MTSINRNKDCRVMARLAGGTGLVVAVTIDREGDRRLHSDYRSDWVVDCINRSCEMRK